MTSCKDPSNEDELICKGEDSVITRFYDIDIKATDNAKNVGEAKCSVVVVPEGHFQGPSNMKSGKRSYTSSPNLPSSGFSSKSGRKCRPKGVKGSKKSSSKAGLDIHDPNVLRLEYQNSLQRFTLSRFSHEWDPTLVTSLNAPPLPASIPVTGSSKKSKSPRKPAGQSSANEEKAQASIANMKQRKHEAVEEQGTEERRLELVEPTATSLRRIES